MKYKILSILKQNKEEFVSGEKLSEYLSISRTAIWKHINSLKDEGYLIDSSTNKGYKLLFSPDTLNKFELTYDTPLKLLGKNLLYFNSIGSTNDLAKELANKGEPEGTIIITEEQTKGRGRLGRSWFSSKGENLMFSIILRPKVHPSKASLITQIAGVALNKTLRDMTINSFIKWPNDIVLNNKKLSGILTEMSTELDYINYLILGVGININTSEFRDDVKDIATSLKIEYKQNFSRKDILKNFLINFEKLYIPYINCNDKSFITLCNEYSILTNRTINFSRDNKIYSANVVSINDNGELIVKDNEGIMHILLSGEVSMHGLYYCK